MKNKLMLLLVGICTLGFVTSNAWAQSSINASLQAITDIQLTPEGQHLNYIPNCSPGYSLIGSVIDSGGGVSNGHQFFCAKFERVAFSSGKRVVTDFRVLDGNTHAVGGLPCPQRYNSIGTVTDCAYGKCYGNQTVCVKFERLTVWSSGAAGPSNRLVVPLSDLFITDPGAHVVGGLSCPAAFQTAGNVADCGSGQCYGNQIFCKR